MPKINKKIGLKAGDYNLKEQFLNTKNDAEYTSEDASKLLVWIRGNSATDLKDDSNFNRTVTESNLSAVTTNKINYQSYSQTFNSVGFNGTNSVFTVPDIAPTIPTSCFSMLSFSAEFTWEERIKNSPMTVLKIFFITMKLANLDENRNN